MRIGTLIQGTSGALRSEPHGFLGQQSGSFRAPLLYILYIHVIGRAVGARTAVEMWKSSYPGRSRTFAGRKNEPPLFPVSDLSHAYFPPCREMLRFPRDFWCVGGQGLMPETEGHPYLKLLAVAG